MRCRKKVSPAEPSVSWASPLTLLPAWQGKTDSARHLRARILRSPIQYSCWMTLATSRVQSMPDLPKAMWDSSAQTKGQPSPSETPSRKPPRKASSSDLTHQTQCSPSWQMGPSMLPCSRIRRSWDMTACRSPYRLLKALTLTPTPIRTLLEPKNCV